MIQMERSDLTRFAWLSISAALATVALKALAYFVTDSVGLLSDALESLVNLAAALMALAMLVVAARPADEMHAFGYSKAEYFSSGVEGTLIVLAAAIIAWTTVPRLIAPQPLEQIGTGLAASIIAAALNFCVARHLLSGSRQYRSITLEADAHHLMTDVWTSAGVVAGIAIVALTGWTRLDAVIALCVAVNILWKGVRLLRALTAWTFGQGVGTDRARTYQGDSQPVCQPGSLLSRAAHAPGGSKVVYLLPCAGARRMDCAARARFDRTSRARHTSSGPRRNGLHSPRTDQ